MGLKGPDEWRKNFKKRWCKSRKILSSTTILNLFSYLLSCIFSGTYYCQANNSIGVGLPCELEVQGLLSLKMGSANVIIIVAVIAACIVGCCIIVVVVVLICRRRKPNEKCKFFFTLPTYISRLGIQVRNMKMFF